MQRGAKSPNPNTKAAGASLKVADKMKALNKATQGAEGTKRPIKPKRTYMKKNKLGLSPMEIEGVTRSILTVLQTNGRMTLTEIEAKTGFEKKYVKPILDVMVATPLINEVKRSGDSLRDDRAYMYRYGKALPFPVPLSTVRQDIIKEQDECTKCMTRLEKVQKCLKEMREMQEAARKEEAELESKRKIQAVSSLDSKFSELTNESAMKVEVDHKAKSVTPQSLKDPRPNVIDSTIAPAPSKELSTSLPPTMVASSSTLQNANTDSFSGGVASKLPNSNMQAKKPFTVGEEHSTKATVENRTLVGRKRPFGERTITERLQARLQQLLNELSQDDKDFMANDELYKMLQHALRTGSFPTFEAEKKDIATGNAVEKRIENQKGGK